MLAIQLLLPLAQTGFVSPQVFLAGLHLGEDLFQFETFLKLRCTAIGC